MNQQVDARGLSCPKPVIETKKLLDKYTDGVVTTIVDNEVAMKNVTKLAKSLNYNVEVKEEGNDFYINIYKGDDNLEKVCEISEERDLVILFGSDKLGQGSEELGKILMNGYIYTLTEYTPYPKTLLFINGGVKLTVEGSEVLKYLKQLEGEGVEILSCGTCLDYFHLKEKLAVGSVTNMYTILDTLHSAKNKVTL
ncbi:sulfurtransferase-like selenium metabolism protein YedF [Crassaminicella thermophila]|uniref:Sulfurtransferase-like selenium metabolism protein YedF n=1 Tax=Crassaminicella thermophila TaxID=2599308 RepID=A0A5C0SH35_CRATE|nr:sulfurtransferase-like selenium metabolism protein YedF [Crassaminicella thermophila]QEK13510.1 sulfurtransferase-like selenium metabolism protein YedF [Crassaminicella thermophila]